MCDTISEITKLVSENIVTFRYSKAAEIIGEKYLTGIPKLLALCSILTEQRPSEDEAGICDGLSDLECGFLNSLSVTSTAYRQPDKLGNEPAFNSTTQGIERALLLTAMDSIILRDGYLISKPKISDDGFADNCLEEVAWDSIGEDLSSVLIKSRMSLDKSSTQDPNEGYAGHPTESSNPAVTERKPREAQDRELAGYKALKPSQGSDYLQAFLKFLANHSGTTLSSLQSLSSYEILSLFLGQEELDRRLKVPAGRTFGANEDELDLHRGYRYELYYTSREISSTTNKNFFEMKQGYSGIGPIGAKDKDLVCVLFGLNCPIVLRRVKEHYVLVGPCYVLGLMDGEAIGFVEKGETELSDFEIW